MGSMICTHCFKDTGIEPDFHSIAVSPGDGPAIADLCEHWLCDDCLDDLDAEAVAQGLPPPTRPREELSNDG